MTGLAAMVDVRYMVVDAAIEFLHQAPRVVELFQPAG